MQLHELHTRSLESALVLADESILRMHRLLEEAGQRGVVRQIRCAISQEARASLLENLNSLQAQLNDFAAEFQLGQRILEVDRVLRAELSSLWVTFEDCRAKRMAGYGQIFDPEARATLESRLDSILAQIERMRVLLDNGHR